MRSFAKWYNFTRHFSEVKLSIIIVNYNVQHFLEQCLHSVRKAAGTIPLEIFVVDNNSVDGSVAMVREKFPEVILIANQENTGFSKANNQAMRIAQGEYVLLLNPDTVVEETTFSKVIAFMDAHPKAGGLGVQMLDGKGNFLPESKRGLPTPAVAFYKIFGLSRIFPKSKTFGRYHLGYLDQHATHEIEVLSGAFMLMRKTTLDQVGLLDEAFFMYGEDIDLSYRIVLGGWKNYYYHDTRIIHYKGESTKKSSVNYVFVFYRAMVIFAQKHFSQKNARLFSLLINMAIWLRAGAAIAARFIKAMALPALDAAIILGGLYFIKHAYETNVKLSEGDYYSNSLVNIAFPAYTLIWLISVYFSGGYDKPIRLLKIVRGLFAGTALILIVYALLPEGLRFSRALILLGAGWAMTGFLVTRMLFHIARFRNLRIDSGSPRRIVIVGSEDECKRVQGVLRQTNVSTGFVGFVDSASQEHADATFLGRVNQLSEIVTIYTIDEVVFCAKDLPAEKIIDLMAVLSSGRTIDYKIAPPESLSLIGSNSIDTAGDLYVIDINSVSKPVNRRNKRVVDVGLSLFFIGTLPLLIGFMRQPIGFFTNCFSVLFGLKSWIGYADDAEVIHLPKIRKGVLSPADAIPQSQRTKLIDNRLNMLYAKDYKIEHDLNVIRKAFRQLGNR